MERQTHLSARPPPGATQPSTTPRKPPDANALRKPSPSPAQLLCDVTTPAALPAAADRCFCAAPPYLRCRHFCLALQPLLDPGRCERRRQPYCRYFYGRPRCRILSAAPRVMRTSPPPSLDSHRSPAGFVPQRSYNVNQRFPAHAAACAMRTRPNPAAAAFLPPRRQIRATAPV
ncbi:hypothetical protein B0H19DRAFT_1262629 [Mycena capillaripes]|nr:hypothetical protein B0H19DRAFT_1262629 [Mycena capillaripes]